MPNAAIAILPSVPLAIMTEKTATGAGSVFALPSRSACYLAWQTTFDVNPDAVNVTIRVSIDGLSWTVLDTSTAVGGETRTIEIPTAAIFVDANLVTNTGSHKVTVTLVAKVIP